MNLKYLIPVLSVLSLTRVYAQKNTLPAVSEMSMQQYLNLVGRENIGYATQKYDVSIAEAGIESARVFPDPEFSTGVFDNQQKKLKLGQGVSFGLSTTLELGGKRTARIALAKSETELNKAVLLDYLRNLRADAAIAYYNAVEQQYLLRLQQQSYLIVKQIADADSIRYQLGSISQTDARQSKLEANNLLSGIDQYEANWQNARLVMGTFAGKKNPDTLICPAANFENLTRTLNLESLIEQAQHLRADAIAATNSKTVADKGLALVKANRVTDLGINAGLQFNGVSINEIAPTPYHKTVNVGISFPLKFSNRYKGDLKAARFTIQQAGLRYESVLQQIRSEVAQAYFSYLAAQKQVVRYQNGLLSEGKKVLDAKIYSYKRGETSLLEVLIARRIYSDTQQAYYSAQANYARAWVELERAAGIWDI